MKLDLGGPWRMKGTDEAAWIDARVPGSVYADLLAAGRIEDPFYRDNETKVRDVSLRDFEYERSFTLPRELADADRVCLCCDGLDTLCEIRLNGALAAKTDNMHRRYELDVKDLLVAGVNTLHLVFRSPLRFITDAQARYPLQGSPEAMPGFPHLRKAHCMFGWDWGPQLPDMGIWRSISLAGFRSGRITDVYVTQKHEPGAVELDVRVRTDVWGPGEHALQLAVTAPDGKKRERSEKITGNETHLGLMIEKPELWWPRGLGEQPLYDVEVRLQHAGGELDEKRLSIGLRTLAIRREKDPWGESFELCANGVSFFAMGADYIPEDNILSRVTPERTERLIKNCVAANFNCIRVWGGGLYPEDHFFDFCDQAGLVVWQDLMFACATYDLTESFAQNIRTEAEDNIRRIRHHACLGLWCGNNEIEVSWADGTFHNAPKQKADYLAQFETILAQAAKETDPRSFYWPSSPSSGGGFDDPNCENRGDVHYWAVWHGGKPFTEYRKFFFRFASEFGFQSFPSLKTIASFTRPEDRSIFSPIMECHQKNRKANARILQAISQSYKDPKDFGSLLYASQLLQAEAMRYGVEHWRRNRGRCMGAIYWQLNDCWPVASWSSVDYFGRWKALHYFARRFFEPVLLSVCETGTKAGLHVSNETRVAVAGEAAWSLRTSSSEILRSGTTGFNVEPMSSRMVTELDFTEAIPDAQTARSVYLEYSLRRDGATVRTGTLLFVTPKHFQFLDPSLRVEVREEEDRFIVTVSARAYAKSVELDLSNTDCIFSDNYFDLSGGEERVIDIPKASMSASLNLLELRAQLEVRSVYDMAG